MIQNNRNLNIYIYIYRTSKSMCVPLPVQVHVLLGSLTWCDKLALLVSNTGELMSLSLSLSLTR